MTDPDFQVGDEVLEFGTGRTGKIINISKETPTDEYPITILFVDGTQGFYTISGKDGPEEKHRIIYHAGTKFNIHEPKPVRETWVNVYYVTNINTGKRQLESSSGYKSLEDAQANIINNFSSDYTYLCSIKLDNQNQRVIWNKKTT